MRKTFICLILLLGALLLLAGCGGKTDTAGKNLTFSGRIEAESFTLKAPLAGKLHGLIVTKGERIRKGQPLFASGRSDYSKKLEQAAASMARTEAEYRNAMGGGTATDRASAQLAWQNSLQAYDEASRTYNKMKRLYALGAVPRNSLTAAEESLAMAEKARDASRMAVEESARSRSPEEVEALKKAHEAAKKEFETLKNSPAANEVSSPVTGVITEVLLKNGTEVTPGQDVLELRSTSSGTIRIAAAAPDSRIRPGMSVQIGSKNLQSPFPGTVKEVTEKGILIYTAEKPEDLPDNAKVEITIPLES